MKDITKSMEIVRAFKQLVSSIKHTIKHQYKDMNLTGPQGMLVGLLAHNGQMKISEISEKLDLSNSTVSGMVDRLEKLGRVERIRCEEDRRVVYVNITPDFKKTSEERFKEIERNIADRISSANQEDLDKIIEALNILEGMFETDKENKQCKKGDDR